MADNRESSSALELKAAAKRIGLSATIGQLRWRLTPARLAEEATGELGHLSSAAAHTVLAKAKSPIGIGATGLGVAMAAYFLSQARSPKTETPEIRPLPRVDAFEERKTKSPPHHPPGGSASVSLLKLAAAIGVGISLNKLIPVTAKEQELLHGVGQEVQTAIDHWTKEQAKRLVNPPPGSAMGLVNFLALAVGVLSNGKTHSV